MKNFSIQMLLVFKAIFLMVSKRIGGVTVSLLASSAVYCGFEP